MTTFVIVTPPDNPKKAAVKEAVARVFPGEFMEIADGQYVASADGITSQEVSLRLDAYEVALGGLRSLPSEAIMVGTARICGNG